MNRSLFVAFITFFSAFAATLLTSACGNGKHHGAHKHSFKDVKKYEKMFESPERDARQKPEAVVRRMEIKAGMFIADIGAGTGYFARRFARAAGKNGRVTAYDVEPAMTEHVNRAARRLGLSNLSAETIAASRPKLPRRNFDIIFLCNTYHHIAERETYFRNLLNAVKLTGRLVIVDFKKDAGVERPPRRYRISREDAMNELKRAGYECKADTELLPDQYYLECRPRLMRRIDTRS